MNSPLSEPTEQMLNDVEGQQLVQAIHDRKRTQPANNASPGGWAFPNSSNRAKAHYFASATMMAPSLCGKWGYIGHPVQGGADSPPSKDDCGACRKKLEAAK